MRLFSLEKRKLWGDLTAAFQYLKEVTRPGEGLFTGICRYRTKGNGFKLRKCRCRLDNKKFFTVRLIKHRRICPEKLWFAPSLEVFKAR